MTRQRKVAVRAALLLTISIALLSWEAPLLAQRATAARDVCQQFELSASTIYQPIWVESRDQILAYSPSARKVIGLLGNGKNAGTAYPELQADAFSRLGDEFLRFRGMFTAEMEIGWLDRYLREIGTFSLLDPAPDSRFEILSLMDWTVTKGGEGAASAYLVGYGAYTQNREIFDQHQGFVLQELYRPETGKRGESALIDGLGPFPHGHYYLLEAAEYFTSIDSTAYILKMEPGRPPELYQFEPAKDPVPTKLANLPGGDRPLPAFDRDNVGNWAEYLDWRQPILDSNDIIRGIYSQENLLYILSRHPQEGWQLAQFQVLPTKDAIKQLGRMTIPSDARAISLLPTKDRWFVFEHHYDSKPLEAFSMLVVPTEIVKNSRHSPLYGPGAKWIRCAKR